MLILFISLLAMGALLMAAGQIMFLIAAFRQGVPWGLAVLFLPLAPLVFMAAHWAQARKAFLVQLLGLILCGGAIGFAVPRDAGAFLDGLPVALPGAIRRQIEMPAPAVSVSTAQRAAPGADGNYVGLTVGQVIRLRGKPPGRLEVDGQVMLRYPDLELTAADGRTITHQGIPTRRK